jgi:hypothetical protein
VQRPEITDGRFPSSAEWRRSVDVGRPPRHSSEMMDRINKIAWGASVARIRRSFTENLWVVGSSFGALRPFQGRIEATMDEQACHTPFLERLLGPLDLR